MTCPGLHSRAEWSLDLNQGFSDSVPSEEKDSIDVEMGTVWAHFEHITGAHGRGARYGKFALFWDVAIGGLDREMNRETMRNDWTGVGQRWDGLAAGVGSAQGILPLPTQRHE